MFPIKPKFYLAVKKAVMNIYQAASSNSEEQQGSLAAHCKSLEAIGGNQISSHLLFSSTTLKIASARRRKSSDPMSSFRQAQRTTHGGLKISAFLH
jgi:hypothetical protein